MCTGRVDQSFILRAFRQGADGVIIAGCWPGECHYITEGNYDALGNTYLGQRILTHLGLSPERLRLEWLSASEGSRCAEVMNDFVGVLRRLGPLGRGEGIDPTALPARLAAMERLVPYLRLVERERLRVPEKSEEAYRRFYTSADAERLFRELIADKLAVSEIVALLKDRPRSTGDIAQALSLAPSEVARHMASSSRHGLVRYDLESRRYLLA
jgi:coenzyme F420-reducing hydrogenase delta subunit